MLRLNRVRRRLKPFGLEMVSTGRGKHPFKVIGLIQGTTRRHTYPLKVHGKNPEISSSYLHGMIEEFNLPEDVFD